MVKITREFIEQHRTAKGGFTFAQCKALGSSYPPERGWLKRAVEIDHTEDAIRMFCEFKTKAQGKQARRAQRKERRVELAEVQIVYAVAERPVRKKAPPAAVPKLFARCDPASNEFLESFEWRAVRMLAIKKYGRVCQCCGASAKTGAVIHVDHIKPRKLFPRLALDVENLQILCHECNHGKGNWDMTDWRPLNCSPRGKG
jgi:5-methylcytosine-specific restriction endonuclease McrA